MKNLLKTLKPLFFALLCSFVVLTSCRTEDDAAIRGRRTFDPKGEVPSDGTAHLCADIIVPCHRVYVIEYMS